MSSTSDGVVSSLERRLLSTGDAAREAGCHPTTILAAIHRGELEAFRLGRRGDHRITPEALEAWKQPATEEAAPCA